MVRIGNEKKMDTQKEEEEIRRSPWILCGTPHQSPQCVLVVCEKFAENPEFRVGNFAINLKRQISHTNLKCHAI